MNPYYKELEQDFVSLTVEAVDAAPLSGQEKGVADMFLREMEAMGVEHYRDAIGNVVGVLRGTAEGPCVLLNGHMDVVPEGTPEAWGDIPPFKGTVRDGCIYGRGTVDMLSGLVSVFLAFREIKRLMDKGAVLKGNLIFSGVVFEEPAECAGMIELMDKTLPGLGLKPDVVYLAEPSQLFVNTAQRGKVELVVEVFGKVAHSSAPEQGVSAVEKAQPVIDALLHNFYEAPMTHDILGKSAMTITDIRVTPGRMYSCVPDYCEITIDRRYVLPCTIPDTIAQIQQLLDKLSAEDPDFKAVVHQRVNHRVAYTGFECDVPKQHPVWLTDKNSPFHAMTFEALRAIGQDAVEGCNVGGTDGSISCGVYGIPTFVYAGGGLRQCHQPKEHVVIDEALAGIEGYCAILKKIFAL